MKSEKNLAEQRLTFPCLMVDGQGAVVLFTEPEKGFLVHESFYISAIGTFSSSWDMSCFKMFHGTITLSND